MTLGLRLLASMRRLWSVPEARDLGISYRVSYWNFYDESLDALGLISSKRGDRSGGMLPACLLVGYCGFLPLLFM